MPTVRPTVVALTGLFLLITVSIVWAPRKGAAHSSGHTPTGAMPSRVAPVEGQGGGAARQEGETAVKAADGGRLRLPRGHMESAKLLAAGNGWALERRRLLWTTTNGRAWRDITPAAADATTLDAAFFLDSLKGWVVLGGADDSAGPRLARTTDGGQNWAVKPIPHDDDLQLYGGKASIFFADVTHGWVMLRLASNSNFSRGLLYATSDGGHTWERLPAPPIADPVSFSSASDGWLAGGPDGGSLYRTRDGGHTWRPASVPAPQARPDARAIYSLHEFQGGGRGVLAVTHAAPQGLTITIYDTEDGGETWRARTTVPLQGDVGAAPASSAVSPEVVMLAPSAGADVVVLEKGKPRPTRFSLDGPAPDSRIIGLDFRSREEGWLLVSSGRCDGFKTGCRQETILFSTEDAGRTLTDITPVAPADFPTPAPGDPSPEPSGPGGAVRISDKKGFDKCAAGTVSNMQTWWTSSPYWDANIYIGGSSRACTQANLTASWVDQVSTMGWGLIPTWVGPQAPCTGFASRISSNTATAQAQGVSEADSAANAAAALGLTQGTVIYYDLEHYNADAACSAAVRAFLNGWVGRMHARGNVAGVYGSPVNAAADWVSISNPPDAVWIAKWDGRETVWGLTPLGDSLWFNHQRIHQYNGGHNETWGGVTFNIDNNIADGPVAGVRAGAPQLLPNLTPFQPTGWSNKVVVSTGIGTTTDSATLRTTDTLFIDWAVTNNGAAATAAIFHTKLFVDGVERASWFTNPPLSPNFFSFIQDFSIGTLSAGTHTIRIVTDAFGAVGESNESDNEFTRTITVVSPGQPNLTPFQPAGWSNKVVVSNVAGTSTDTASLKSTDTLFIDWAVTNNGTLATASTFHTRLLVDGVERANWFTNPPLDVNFFTFVQDFSVGSLSPGTHTLTIVTDSGGAIAESNESDNQFTKTITVAAPPTACRTLTTGVSPGGGGTVVRNTAPNCTSAPLEQEAPAPAEMLAAPTLIGSDAAGEVVRSPATEEAFSSLIAKAQQVGPVRVIVGLNVAFQPEGALPGAPLVDAQRDRIADAQDRILDGLSAFNAQSIRKYPFIPYVVVELGADGLTHLQNSPEVLSVEEDKAYELSLAESAAIVGAPAAWASGFSGAGQTIAVLDTGVDKTHPFLAGKVVSEACFSTTGVFTTSLCPGGVSQSTSPGSGANCNPATIHSDCKHGTHVAGIAAGKGTTFSGVARDANVIAIQIFSRPNAGGRLTFMTQDLLSGLQRVQALSGSFNIASVNLSLGGPLNTATCDSLSPSHRDAINSLRSLGIATVAASGNNSNATSIAFPACISTAVSVGSTDDGSSNGSNTTLRDQVSDFSNSASFLSLLAPGRWITSSVPGGSFEPFPGTSMAAPHVAGAWAVLKSKSPTASVTQILSALSSTGLPITDQRNFVTTPRIRVDAALNALGGGTAGQYSNGTAVSLSAVPSAGFRFVSWTGCDSAAGTNCSVTMNASRAVTANFTPTRVLTIASNPASGAGVTVSPADNSGQGSGVTQFTRTYDLNAPVTLTAPATAGANTFVKWQRDGIDFSTARTINVTADANRTFTAVYAAQLIQVTVQSNPAGRVVTVDGVNHTAPQTFSWAPGSAHTIAAASPQAGAPGTRYAFAGWSDGGAASHTVAPTAGTTYTANFTTQHFLTVSQTAGGTASPSGGGWFNSGQAVSISASPNAGFVFAGWTGTGTGSYTGPNNPATVTMSGPISETPSFRQQTGARNVALAANGATATASSTLDPGRGASGVINGDRRGLNWGAGGGWHDSTQNVHPDWVQVNFSGAKTINEIDVFTLQDNYTNPAVPTEAQTFSLYGVTAFDVQYESAPNVWTTVPGGSVAGNNKVWRKFTFANITTARIRVLVTGALAGYSRVVEVEAYEAGGTTPPPPPSEATGTNVALAANGGVASASSTLDAGRSASGAINGDRRGLNWGAGGGWHDATSNAHPDWLQVDFAGVRQIERIEVFTIQDNYASPSEPTAAMAFSLYGITAFDVQYWNGAAWVTVPGGSVAGNNLVGRTFNFPALTTTRIRVLVNGALAGYSRIVEVEAYTPKANVALAANGGVASASSTLDAGRAASAVNNGDRRGLNWGSDPATGSGWHDATASTFPDWVQVNFSGMKTVSEVRVFTLQDGYLSPAEPTDSMAFSLYGVTAFDVQYWNGAAWVTVPGGSVAGNNLVKRSFAFAPVTTDRVRVLVTGALAGYSRLTEIEVY